MTVARKGTDIGRMDEPTARLAIGANLPVFDSLAIYNSADATLTGSEYPERVAGARVSRSFFDVLDVKPAAGRTFTDDELRAGGPAAIVLSDAAWIRIFGRRPTIVGERIPLNDRIYEVVGVMPPGFGYPGRAEFWLPLIPRPITGGVYYIDFIGRLQPSASVEEARTALGTLRESRKRELPATVSQSELRVMSLHERLYGNFRRPLVLLLGLVACVLLIGCANIANLLLARSSTRRGELALRLAVGASRRRLLRQLLVESLLLACLGALPGIALALVGMRAFREFGPPALARLPTLAIDNQVLLFTLVLTIGTGLLFGLAPAVSAARMDPEDGLRRGRAAHRDSRWTPRRMLVVLEIAAAVVLTLGGALLAKSFSRFQAVDRGFRADNVLTASITLSMVRYPDAASRRAFFDSLVERLRALPAVESVAVSDLGLSGMSMTMEWPPANERGGDTWEIAVATGVGNGHFRTFGIPILEGRECADHADGAAVVINAAMARRTYGERSPLGERLNLSTVSLGTRVVLGVAADVPDIQTKAAPLPTVYACAGQNRAASGLVALRVRDDTAAAALAPALRTAVRELDPAQPVSRLRTVEQMVRNGMSSRWFDAIVIGALSTLALILALGGLYAVTAYSVAQRTREIGVRMALGADRARVMSLILRQGGVLVAAGTSLGLLAAVPLVRLVTTMLFDVQPLDPGVFSGVAVLVAAAAMLATFVPARRASRVDPMVALRAE
jgi:putative ABC transport system permease protein